MDRTNEFGSSSPSSAPADVPQRGTKRAGIRVREPSHPGQPRDRGGSPAAKSGPDIAGFFAASPLLPDGSIDCMRRRSTPSGSRSASIPEGAALLSAACRGAEERATDPWGASGAPAFEITFAALAAAAGEGSRGDGWIAFRVEATGVGVLQKWNGLAWATLVAGGTAVAQGEKLRWTPGTAERTSAFIVRPIGLAKPSPASLGRSTERILVFNVAEDGASDVVLTREDSAQQAHVASALLESREELRRLSALLVSIQEDERRRIALDLHDGLGQTLGLIKLSIENSAQLLAGGAAGEACEALQRLLPRVRDAMADVRRVSTELRPLILDDLGILPTLSWFFREFSSLAAGVGVEAELQVSEREVPARLHITIFRIVQEAFHNVLKHAAARQVHVRLVRSGLALHLSIEDDGRGFDPAAPRQDALRCRGYGLLGMEERAALTGGTYQLESACGRGTRIRVCWPRHADD